MILLGLIDNRNGAIASYRMLRSSITKVQPHHTNPQHQQRISKIDSLHPYACSFAPLEIPSVDKCPRSVKLTQLLTMTQLGFCTFHVANFSYIGSPFFFAK